MSSDTAGATGEKPEEKPVIQDVPTKSSMEILSELFNSFDAEPPIIVKKEKSDSPKKNKKAKKKHKHKDKKHKKKDKKRRRSSSSSSDKSEIDLAGILIKQEKEAAEQKIKIEGTDLSFNLDRIKKEKESVNGKSPSIKHENNDATSEVKTEVVPVKTEEGELTSSDHESVGKKQKKRKKHKHDHEKVKKVKKEKPDSDKHKGMEESQVLQQQIEDLRNKLKANRDKTKKERSRSRDARSRSRSRSREHRHKDRRDREVSRSSRENSFYRHDNKSDDDFWSRCRSRRNSSRDRDREWDRRRDGDRSRRASSRDSSHIDKKKLLEIARKNAIQMMKSGSLPGALTLGRQAQEKVIAAIKAGGQTIEELTDFCKTLSKKEAMGELSSNSERSDSDTDVAFHHPFQIKDRPTTITMNIKNSVPLPTKTTQERSTELRLQFPVSSGQSHRKTEGEWVPVPPTKKHSTKNSNSTTSSAALLAIEAAPPSKAGPTPTPVPPPATAVPGPQVFPPSTDSEEGMDIGSIVSQRLTALRKLQENPNDVQALTEVYKSNKEMQSWAQSKQQPGQFTGSTGANVMSAAELTSGYQAWAKKDQLTTASPVSGGMGMHLLQKMGWKPGEGLGKEKTGALEPLLLEVKLDKKGLVASEEQKKRKKQGQPTYTSFSMQNKHPVSLLGEYASKKKLGAPQYDLCFECGPDHKKNFLFKVTINGVEYKPNIASPNKKEAKAAAAQICLQHLGVLSASPTAPAAASALPPPPPPPPQIPQ